MFLSSQGVEPVDPGGDLPLVIQCPGERVER